MASKNKDCKHVRTQFCLFEGKEHVCYHEDNTTNKCTTEDCPLNPPTEEKTDA